MIRSRFRTVLLMLVAVSAFGAVASASASAALPEFKPARGKFPIKFKMYSEAPTLQRADGVSWQYLHVHGSGEITGPQAVANVTFTFEEGKNLSSRCYSAPTAEHKLVWPNLKGRLGYLAPKQVGLKFEPTGQRLGECKWENIWPAEFVGALVGQLGEIGKTVPRLNLKFQQTKGLDSWLALEGEAAAPLYEVSCPESKEGKCEGLPKESEEKTVGLEDWLELTFENSEKAKEEIKIEA
jgi:hypothetical protein